MIDKRLSNLSIALSTVANECVEGGVPVHAVADATATGLGMFLAQHYGPAQAAALLRIQAATIERENADPGGTVEEAELAELPRRFHEFVNTLQIAGIEERHLVAAMMLAALERVARSSSAEQAVAWVRGMADHAEANPDHLSATARHT